MKKLLIAAFVVTLGACATSNPDMVRRGDAQQMSQVQDAVILSIRAVTVDGAQSGGGAAAGGVVGALAGSSVGGRRDGQVAGILGAVAGAMIGNAVERSGTKEEALELLLQLRNGERRMIVQGKGSEILSVGDAVILITSGNKTRVTRAPVVR
jgi:outer membrane lipoprotein SlyB